ncbi:nephrocystin-4-like isoform X2 [Xenopus laevis]|uniref:Nephrocystin-4-like isoform X2 n=1 Tax=Xenopus laevis TaxID=8355 RepID=A0A8J0T989_XENLA|nr:nephrocystin-4-like isoform X2 [Xenopus laevis]
MADMSMRRKAGVKMKDWENIFSQSHIIPPHKQRCKHAPSEKAGYQICIETLEGTPFRQGVLERSVEVSCQLRMTLFDSTYHHFFGRTWKSSTKPIKAIPGKASKILFNEPIYFYTTLIDPSIMAVIEVVALSKKQGGSKQQLSCGFGIMSLFSHQLEDDSSIQSGRLKLYYGTPRSLLHPTLKDPNELNQHMTLIENTSIQYSVRPHKVLPTVAHLFPENVLVSGSETIPGIMPSCDDSGDALKKPHVQKTVICYLDQICLFLYPTLEKFEEELTMLVNSDWLPKDDGNINGGSVSIQERRLHIGVHNGWVFVQKPQIVVVVPEAEMMRGHSTTSLKKKNIAQQKLSSTVQALVLRSRIRLPEMVNHHGFALVFLLEYVFSIPNGIHSKTPSAASSTSYMHMIRWASWTPSMEQGSADVALPLQGGPHHNPSNNFVYKMPPANMSSEEVQQVESGTVHFTFCAGSENQLEKTRDFAETTSKELIQSKKNVKMSNSKLVPETTFSPLESQVGPALSISQLTTSPRYPAISHSSKTAMQYIPSQLLPSPMAYQLSHAELPYASSITHLEADMSESHPNNSNGEHLQELLFSPVHAPIVAMGTQTGSTTSLLSRASLARLHSVEFPEILDCNNEVAEVVDPSNPVNFNLQREEADYLLCNEIVLQFLAFTRIHDGSTIWPESIFFTFQFYRFHHVTTPRLQLLQLESSDIATADPLTHVLVQINKDGSIKKGSPGFQIKYSVDPGFLKPGERKWFLRFLALQTLQIDIWDGESLLLIGSAAVEMKHLLRQGRTAVQVSHELEVITTEYEQDLMVMSGDTAKQGTAKPIGVHTIIKGRLHMRMGNVGRPPEKKLKRRETLPPSNSRIITMHDGRTGFHGGSMLSNKSMNWKQSVCQAHKLADLDSELAAMLCSRMKEVSIAYQQTSSETDTTERRKKERMMAVRQQESQENANLRKSLIMAQHEERTQHTRDLQIIEAYRERTKPECISSMLNQAITSNYTVYATLGTAEFFEFELKNPYNIQYTVTIEIDSTDLRVITDTREWKHFKELTSTVTPIEENMFHVQPNTVIPQLYLRAKETVYIPFKYQTFCVDHTPMLQGPDAESLRKHSQLSQYKSNAMSSRRIMVSFKTSDGKLIAILQVNIEPQPHVVDQTFRFYHPELTFLKKSIRLPPWYTLPGAPVGTPGGEPDLQVRCSDINIICDSKKMGPGEPQDVFIKVAGGPSPQIKRFFIALYIDPWLAAPIQIWQIYVHSLKRVDVSCITGQLTQLSLVLRGTQVVRKVRAYSSHPEELKVDPDGVFVLPPNGIQDLHIGVRPQKAGSKFIYLNLVDVDQHQLVASWLVCVSCRKPVISKAFEIALPVGGEKGCNKKISYRNPYPTKKTYSLYTNRSDLLQFKENYFEVAAGETYSIGLRFAPSQTRGQEEILIFINDREDKNEETFCVKVRYE